MPYNNILKIVRRQHRYSMNFGFSTFLGFLAFLLSLYKSCLVEGASAGYYLN